jgi:hypothetical protein
MGTWGKTAADSFAGFGKDWLSKIKKENEFSYDKYVEDGDVTKAKEAYDTHLLDKPGDYHSRWAGQLDSIMGKIAGRKPFEYDINADALYQQAAERYAHLGKIGMEDAIGKSSALTGGYGNSFAQSAGQQAYAESLNDLNNMIPQFYQMALDKYIMEGNQLSEQYGMISDRESMDYGRYRDSISDWMLERDHLADRYDFERKFDYSKYKDERGFAYDEYRDDIEDKQWLKEFKETETHNAWVRSQAPSDDSSGGSGGGTYVDTLWNATGTYDDNGNPIFINSNGKTQAFGAGINPYTGTKHKDAEHGTFSNGYQPNNIDGTKLKNSGMSTNVTGKNQTIWEANGKYWLWRGDLNEYIEVDVSNLD